MKPVGVHRTRSRRCRRGREAGTQHQPHPRTSPEDQGSVRLHSPFPYCASPRFFRCCCAVRTACFHFLPNRWPSMTRSTESSQRSGWMALMAEWMLAVVRGPCRSTWRTASAKIAWGALPAVLARSTSSSAPRRRLARSWRAARLMERSAAILALRSSVVLSAKSLSRASGTTAPRPPYWITSSRTLRTSVRRVNMTPYSKFLSKPPCVRFADVTTARARSAT